MKTITILAVSLFLMSCSNTSDEKSKVPTDSAIHDDHEHGVEKQTIDLNNGEKWKVNAEMTPIILAGNKMVDEYSDGDYKGLAQRLKANNDALIKSCTMTGKSHEELHKWLHTYGELLNRLENAADKEKANEVINEIKESFHTYENYFQ